jgi:hypothetical protein
MISIIEQIRAFIQRHRFQRVDKRLSTKPKVRERDPARIKRKKRRQMARRSRQVNRARAKA